MKNLLKKHGFLAVVIMVSLLMLVFQPQTEIEARRFTGRNLLNFLFMLTPIFICIGLLDVWIERDTMLKIMGER